MAFSVSDITKILEQIPIWKSLVSLPKRIAELERRVAELEEGKVKRTGPAANECPSCRATLVFVNEEEHPQFGVFGHKNHHFKCDGCGYTATRRFIPSEGYK